MAAVLDPSKPFSAELRVIRRLNSSLYRADGGKGQVPGRADSPFATHRLPAEHVVLAPLRNDVPLLDPCCGQLSAGAEVDLGVKGRQQFIDFHHVASALRVPPGSRLRPQTAENSSNISLDFRQDKAWNSRRIPDEVLRARLGVQPQSLRTFTTPTLHSSLPEGPQDGFSSDLIMSVDNSAAVRHFRFTSATQRSYEEVGWDSKLPRRLMAPEAKLENVADPVSERVSSRRYNNRPHLWQAIGSEWNRQQLRTRNDVKKPISFCSACPRSGQIPLYTGTIGSENMDNIDNSDETFYPLTLKRSVMPPYTPTTRRSTIPGFTGKAAHVAVSVPAVHSPPHVSGTNEECGRSAVGHVAPLSRMVTTTTPSNPFLRPAASASHTNTQRYIRQSR